MAKRRMFSLDIVDTDTFLDMPASTQNLYFHLGMRADDDGFVSSPKKITNSVNCSADDFKLLLAKGYIIPFDSGVCVIKDWKINNYLRPDRYTPTMYIAEKKQYQSALLNSGMSSGIPTDIPTVYTGKASIEQDSVEKDSVGKGSMGSCADKQHRKQFLKPTLDEIASYCRERGNSVSPERFFDYYESCGWRVGRNPMKDWKASVRYWERNSVPFQNKGTASSKLRTSEDYARDKEDCF